MAAPVAADLPRTGPGRYRCAAPQPLGQAIAPLRAGEELRVAFRLTRTDTTRAPLAFVRFDGPRGPSRIAVGTARTDRPRMSALVSPPRSRIDDPIYYFPRTREWIILRLSLDPRGMLTVRSNQLERKFRWGPVSSAMLGCQWGEWEIDVWPRSYAATEAARS